MKRITFTVTNDLNYDQRMQRICSTLAGEGYHISLIGRKSKHSPALLWQPYQQQRIACFFSKGKLMYLEFNFRLLLRLLFTATDCICAIDLDTILPVLFSSTARGKKRAYDAHELFTEQKEVVTRPAIHRLWLWVEKFAVPKFKHGYTVNDFISEELNKRYNVSYQVVRNLPKLGSSYPTPDTNDRFIIYQGAVNEGRSFETLIPAMRTVNARLVIYGDGNFFKDVKRLIAYYNLQHKIELKGLVPPTELLKITPKAYAAIMLFENTGLNQYQSLANRFFDYIMAGVPQVCVNYPQYKAINDKYDIAALIEDTSEETIEAALNNLLHDTVYHDRLQQNCIAARNQLNWENEQDVLLTFYKGLFAER